MRKQIFKDTINHITLRVIFDGRRKRNPYAITKEVCYGKQSVVIRYQDLPSCLWWLWQYSLGKTEEELCG